ncbi:MAG: GDP-mannose 4,6-dehydratase [Candidatus Rokubacteria bacterium GWC2_70_24]|nr:MAG: GDP-mannose 4,6-dehydratase [Candidatus Rokubacteria bacterium GWC2_70_24]
MRVLITGITGFVGSHMTELALARGAEVFGSARWRSKTENIDHLRDKITLIESNLRDLSSVRTLLETAAPTYVIHLAAQSFVGASWQAPAETLTTNILSQVNLLEAIRGLKISPRFLAVGSSEEYGLASPEELPIKETNPLRPLSPYAVSKVTQDLLGYQYFKSYGLPIIRSRAFNHEGPRRGDVFVTSNFAKQVAEIEAGLREPTMFVGDLKPRRDYSDVRDIVRGYWLLLERGEPGEVYNLCSGRSWAIQQVLDFLLEQSTVKGIQVKTDPARLRPSDVMVLEGDPSRMHKTTGWKVEIPFEQTLSELLDYWRRRIPPVTR